MMAAVAVILVMAIFAIRYWRQEKKQASIIAAGIGLATLAFVLLGGLNMIPVPEFEETHGFNLALIGIIIAAVWQMAGYTMAMYLAGIRGIPEELREAAYVDGASELQVIAKLSYPCCSR